MPLLSADNCKELLAIQELDGIFSRNSEKEGLSKDANSIQTSVSIIIASKAEFQLSTCCLLKALIVREQFEAAMLVLQ